MKRIASLVALSAIVVTFGTAEAAGPSLLDSIGKMIAPPPANANATAVSFQMDNFGSRKYTGQSNPTWTLDVSPSQDVQANYYTLKAEVRSGTGEVLSTGATIAFPTTAQGHVRHMTQSYAKPSNARQLRFTIYDYQGALVATADFDLPTAAGALQQANPGSRVNDKVIAAGPQELTERLDIAFASQDRVTIRNSGSIAVKADLSAKAGFAAGISKNLALSCPAQINLQPGGSTTCQLPNLKTFLECPTLNAVHLVATSRSGNRFEATEDIETGDLSMERTWTEHQAMFRYNHFNDKDYILWSIRIPLKKLSARPGSKLTIAYEIKSGDQLRTYYEHVSVPSAGSDDVLVGNYDFEGVARTGQRKVMLKVGSITTMDSPYCGGIALNVGRVEPSVFKEYTVHQNASFEGMAWE